MSSSYSKSIENVHPTVPVLTQAHHTLVTAGICYQMQESFFQLQAEALMQIYTKSWKQVNTSFQPGMCGYEENEVFVMQIILKADHCLDPMLHVLL